MIIKKDSPSHGIHKKTIGTRASAQIDEPQKATKRVKKVNEKMYLVTKPKK